ncbi:MAG: tcyL [Firmicutes bacterium]|nr:tcyL [Bacillota bacterium]
MWGEAMEGFFNISLVVEALPQLLTRLHITLFLVVAATILGIVAGIIIALLRIYRIPGFNQISLLYISFMRGTPIIVQMFIVYYGLPAILSSVGININRWDKMIFLILTYGLNMAAFLAEIIRAAIVSVPIGQTEAAYAVGMTRLQTFWRIIAPQAVLMGLPSIGINIVGLLQDSSIAFLLGIVDVMGKARAIGANTYHSLEAYVGAAVIFLVITLLLEKVCATIERRLTMKIIGD